MTNMKLVLFFVFVIVIQISFVKSNYHLWQRWKHEFGKRYDTDENNQRYTTWKKNLEFVEKHNEKFNSGETTYKMSMNGLADLTQNEFKTMLMEYSSSFAQLRNSSLFKSGFNNSVPDILDWRSEGYVTPVKNQGQIGSCYSFSAVEAVEGQYFKQTGILVSLSEQQIVDCDQGGDGGIPYKVYEYIQRVGGVQTEQDYPYVAKVQKCKFDKSKAYAAVSSYDLIRPRRDEDSLQTAIAQVGPISVSSIKIYQSFQFYHSGVYYEPKCDGLGQPGDGYHAMLATGYGSENGNDYWMVKNSWGTGWGENGYIKMIRNKNNNCGIASQATYPIMSAQQRALAIPETTTSGGNIQAWSMAALLISLVSASVFF
uniref:procathepsin L-like n=1 Tax=Styela clava TaxID=7725 RepID=UPI00193A7C4E|nr:procathepsin L-like [Styela clava]